MNIDLEPISLPKLESLILHMRTTKDLASLVFYIDNIFGAFETNEEQYICLSDHFFPCMVWS